MTTTSNHAARIDSWPRADLLYLAAAAGQEVTPRDRNDIDARAATLAAADLRGEPVHYPPASQVREYLEAGNSLAALHLTAGKIEGRGAGRVQRLGSGLLSMVTRPMAVTETLADAQSQQLMTVANREVARVYGHDQVGRREDAAPFLWAIILERICNRYDARYVPEAATRLFDIFFMSYDKNLQSLQGAPRPLRQFFAAIAQGEPPIASAQKLKHTRKAYLAAKMNTPLIKTAAPNTTATTVPEESEQTQIDAVQYNRWLGCKPQEAEREFMALRTDPHNYQQLETTSTIWAGLLERAIAQVPEREEVRRLVEHWRPYMDRAMTWHVNRQTSAIASGTASLGVLRLAADLVHPATDQYAWRLQPRYLRDEQYEALQWALAQGALEWYGQQPQAYRTHQPLKFVASEAYIRDRSVRAGSADTTITRNREARLVQAYATQQHHGRLWLALPLGVRRALFSAYEQCGAKPPR